MTIDEILDKIRRRRNYLVSVEVENNPDAYFVYKDMGDYTPDGTPKERNVYDRYQAKLNMISDKTYVEDDVIMSSIDDLLEIL